MKYRVLVIICLATIFQGKAQFKDGAEKLVEEGVAYHDKGDFEGAIKRYNEALSMDKDNLLALAEKAYSMFSLSKYDSSISICQRAIAVHRGDKGLRMVYVTYGNACDELKKTDVSIQVYDEGLSYFPNFYQLHFNKGITLRSVKKYDSAVVCFQRAILLRQGHASSHSALARTCYFNQNKRIPALLALCRFFVIEPESERAKENLGTLQKIMEGNAKKDGKKNAVITINSDFLMDTLSDEKSKQGGFSTVDLTLSLSEAMMLDKKNASRPDTEKFASKFETICSTMKEARDKHSGFFWDYYAPYFIEMKDKGLISTFSYIVYASSPDPKVLVWIKSHGKEIDEFYKWSNSYKWPSN